MHLTETQAYILEAIGTRTLNSDLIQSIRIRSKMSVEVWNLTISTLQTEGLLWTDQTGKLTLFKMSPAGFEALQRLNRVN